MSNEPQTPIFPIRALYIVDPKTGERTEFPKVGELVFKLKDMPDSPVYFKPEHLGSITLVVKVAGDFHKVFYSPIYYYLRKKRYSHLN